MPSPSDRLSFALTAASITHHPLEDGTTRGRFDDFDGCAIWEARRVDTPNRPAFFAAYYDSGEASPPTIETDDVDAVIAFLRVFLAEAAQ